MGIPATLGLFLLTALAEILGCYLVLLWSRRSAGAWALLGAALSLAAFAWLLTRHPGESGRVYAAYGGIYTCSALAWLWLVDRVMPSTFDLVGVGIIALGCGIVIAGSLR